MKNIRLREFAKLEYCDPSKFLASLRVIEWAVATSSTPEPIKALRTQKLKSALEKRDAAIFCVGISKFTGFDIRFAHLENQDFDFITRWLDSDGTEHYCPVQLKEVVPPNLNARSSIQTVVDSLTRYVDSEDVTVAIKLNRPGRFEPSELKLPADLRIGGLWIFGSISADQSEFGLWGDFLSATPAPQGLRYAYPAPHSEYDAAADKLA